MVQVKLKWNKETFDGVDVDINDSVGALKRKVYDLTGVPSERQKLMCKGGWIGVLKDDADLKKVKLSENQQILLMGTAEEVIAAPKEAITFFEDMSSTEKAEKGVVISAGLVNLGNTCFMNSTVQCIRHMPELRERLGLVSSGMAPDGAFTIALRETFMQLDHSGVSLPPYSFVNRLRGNFPQFAQRGQSGGFMQQDAEEFYNVLVNSVEQALRAANSSLDSVLNVELQETLTCEETDLEPPVVRSEFVNKLVCNIQNDGTNAGTVNHIHEGVKLSFEGSVEKHSAILNRNALWKRHQRIAVLPRYLCFQFMRFFWRATPESRDHAGVKCKILRKVNFSETFDVYDLCTDALKQKLRHNREVEARKADALFQQRHGSSATVVVDANAESKPSAMEVADQVVADSSSAIAKATAAAVDGSAMQEEEEEDDDAIALKAALAMSVDDGRGNPSSSLPDPSSSNVGSSSGKETMTAVEIGNGLPIGFTGTYELHSLVTHKGRSADSGHYIGWTRQAPGSSRWWKYDDETVTEVGSEEIALLTGAAEFMDTANKIRHFKTQYTHGDTGKEMSKAEKKDKPKGGKQSTGKPDTGSSSTKTGGGTNEEKREQKLQAILLADSFTSTFRPITWQTPKVLLPLVNVPMLDLTLEFLSQNGVKEVFIFCVWHAAMVQDYISQSKWPSSLSVQCIASKTCLSAGDAIRELDGMGVIRSDPFILISGDVISNMDLKKAIQFHKDRKKEDNDCMMTVVLKRTQPATGAKPVVDDLVVALDSQTSQILLFDNSIRKSEVNIPLEILAQHPALSVRYDLLDCQVDICSPELLLQITEHFDYNDIRRDFIRNEAINWDLGMHIYGYLLKDEYAARVHDPRTYHSICRDIVTRWVYPIVPDSQLVANGSYSHLNRCVYREKGVKVARNAQIGEGVVLGEGTVVEEHARIERSVLGRGCFVGRGAVITESHLWSGVTVEENAHVNEAILCDNSVVKTGAQVMRGCIVSYDVVIGTNVILPEYFRVSRRRTLEDCCSLNPEDVSDKDLQLVGRDGVGVLWTDKESAEEDSDEDDIEGQESDVHRWRLDMLRAHSIGCVEEVSWKRNLWSRVPEPKESDDDDENREERFTSNLMDLVLSGRASNTEPHNVLTEIKTCKFGQNKSYVDCLQGVVPALMTIALGGKESIVSLTQGQLVVALQGLLKAGGWGYALLRELVQSNEEELAVIELIEKEAVQSDRLTTLYPAFRFILQILQTAGILSEDVLLEWIAERRAETDSGSERFKLFQEEKVQEFVNWLEEEEDEEEEEEDEEEEGGEDVEDE